MKDASDSNCVVPSVLQQLKAATSVHHRRIEQRFSILDPSLTIDRYRNWLMKLYGFYSPFELILVSQFETVEAESLIKCKSQLLIHDLADLGITENEIIELPRCSDFPLIEDVGSLFGALYVLEGATLGGAFIANHLIKTLRLKDSEATRFFLPYGSDPKPHWESFQKQLIAITANANIDRIIMTAGETFNSFETWLGQE